MALIVDSYKEKDKETVRSICVQTAWKQFTRKPDHIRCVELMYVDYWLEQEPENVLVIRDTETGKAAGYIEASTDQEKFARVQKERYIPEILKRSWLLGNFHRICVGQSIKFDRKYGGGFHINIDPAYQGKKLGPVLMNAMAEHLAAKGIENMYLITQNRKTRGYGFYTHIGFKEVKRYWNGSVALVKRHGTKNSSGE